MDLLLNAERLAPFLDLRPKVFVAAGDPLAAARLDHSSEPPFDVWVFTPTSAATGVIRPQGSSEEDGRLIVVPNPPPATCVAAAQTSEGGEALERLRTWWAANGPGPTLQLLRCREEFAGAEILGVLLRAAQRELRDTTAQVTEATAQIYELRCEYEQMRVAVDGMQQAMLRMRHRPHLLTEHLPASGQVYAPREGGGTLVQPLPVSAEGMAGIDLHFPPRGPLGDDAQVLVHLHALDTGKDLCTWRLLSPHLAKGWVRCWLPEVLAVASHNLEVRIQWLPARGGVPAISLARAGDWDEMLAYPLGEREPIGGCLALTAWAGGVPGTPLGFDPIGCTPEADGSVEYCLTGEEIARMHLHLPAIAWMPKDWCPFHPRPDSSFMLHPFGSLATTLRLANGCIPGIERITATVKITSSQARGDVLYAIAAATCDEASALMDLPDVASDPRFVAFSGWQTVPRDDAPHVLVLDFPEPLAHPAHLLLATRMPPGVDHAWAWADWLEVRMRVRAIRVPRIETMSRESRIHAA